MVFYLHSNCVITKGASRSVICDLQRGRYEFIPNALAEILETFNGTTIDVVKQEFDQTQHARIDEYFNFLHQSELIFFSNEAKSAFPPIDTTYNCSSLITNAILEVNYSSQHDYSSIYDQLDSLGCVALHMVFAEEMGLEKIQTALLGTRFGRLKYIELAMKYSEFTDRDFLEKIFRSNTRIGMFLIYDAPVNKQITIDKFDCIPAIFKKPKITSNRFHPIDPANFVCSIPFYIESMGHNTFFNRKICVTHDGIIRNSLETGNYGNHKAVSMIDVAHSSEFQFCWSIPKSRIKVCMDCEFRFMCTDTRLPILSENGEYYHQTACSYNTYSMEWQT